MTSRRAVRVTRRGAREISDASDWWRANRSAAPDAIREELASAFELIASQPSVGSVAVNARLRGVRRVYLARIRYHLYYRVGESTIDVLAFWHSSRGTAPGL